MKKDKSCPVKKIEKREKKHSVLWGLFVFFLLLFIDQLTKLIADVYFSAPDAPKTVAIIPEWIALCITYNRGIAYGMGATTSPTLKIGVIIATAVLMTVLSIIYFKADKRRTLLKTALVFVVSGGVGNLIDRVYFRVWDPSTVLGVRDMVDLSRFGFAVCNFADFFITAGAVMLVLSFLFFDKDAFFPLGRYKLLAKEAAEKEEKRYAEKQANKQAKKQEKAEKKQAKIDAKQAKKAAKGN